MSSKTCTHIKVNGIRCGSPSLTGEQFCYFHQRMFRTVRMPPRARLHPIANLEDEQAIQASLMEVMNAVLRNTIDIRRAELLIRALNSAIRNIKRARFSLFTDEMVRDIPAYAVPPEIVEQDKRRAEAQKQAAEAAAANAADPHAAKPAPLAPPANADLFEACDRVEAHLRSKQRKPPQSAREAQFHSDLHKLLYGS